MSVTAVAFTVFQLRPRPRSGISVWQLGALSRSLEVHTPRPLSMI